MCFLSKEWTGLLAKQHLHLFVFVIVCLCGRVCICLGGNIGCDSPLNACSASPRWRPTCTLHLEVGPRTYLGHVGILTIGHFGMFGREQIANQVKRSGSLFSGGTWFYLLSSPPGESSPKTNQTLKKTLKNKSERFRFKRVGWNTEKRNFIPCSDGSPRGFGKIFLFLCSFPVCSIQILPVKRKYLSRRILT